MTLTDEQVTKALDRKAHIEGLIARMRERLLDISRYGYTWEDAVADVLTDQD